MIFVRCRRAVRLWSESKDRPVSLAARMGAWFHCLLCSPCRRYVRQTESVCKAASRALRPEAFEDPISDPAPFLSPERRERIRQAIREAQRQG